MKIGSLIIFIVLSHRQKSKLMEISGKIIAVLEPRGGVSRNGNEWKTQEYVIETTQEQYPRKMCFEVFGADKISQFNIQAGEDLTVSFDIDAREWNGRWFNSLRAWRVVRNAAQPAQPTPEANATPFPPAPFGNESASNPFGNDSASGFASDGTGDLPF